MTDNEMIQELNKVYVRVASINGFVRDLQKTVDEMLQMVDELQTKIDTSRVPEHLGNNGDECMGCAECGGMSNALELRIEAIKEQQ